jgi:hypothetical protein
LKALAEDGVVSYACKAANIDRNTAYNHRNADAGFAQAWDDAIEQATDDMVGEARRRAVKGVAEPVFYQGEECGAVQRYSDTLLMFLIKKERPEYRGMPADDQYNGDGGAKATLDSKLADLATALAKAAIPGFSDGSGGGGTPQ